MSDRDVVDNVLTFITAGHETTALALTWTFYLLSLHPEIEERVVQEIEAGTQGRWIEQMVRRENRILDVNINASLQNGTAFFASTSF